MDETLNDPFAQFLNDDNKDNWVPLPAPQEPEEVVEEDPSSEIDPFLKFVQNQPPVEQPQQPLFPEEQVNNDLQLRQDLIPTGAEDIAMPVDDEQADIDEDTQKQILEDLNTWTWDKMSQGLLGRTGGNILGSIANAPVNIAETAYMLRDMATGRNDAEEFRETADRYIPRYKPPEYDPNLDVGEGIAGFQDSIGTGVGELLVGGGLGAKVASGLIKGGGLAARTGKALAIEGGATAALDPETESLILTLGTDNNGTYSEELASKKLSILTESLAMGAAATGLLKTGQAAKGGAEWLLTPLKKLGNTKELEKSVASEILQPLADLQITDDLATQYEKISKVQNAINNNAEVLFDPKIEGVTPRTIQRDTLTAFEKGADDTISVANARGLRSGILGRGSQHLADRMGDASRQTQGMLGDIRTVQGGTEAIDTARRNIQEDVTGNIRAAEGVVTEAENRLLNSKKGIQELIENDPLAASQLDTAFNLDHTLGSFEAGKDVVDTAMDISQKMTKRKNDLYAAIPNDAPIDKDGLQLILDRNDIKDFIPNDIREKLLNATNYKELNDIANFDIGKAMKVARDKQEFGSVLPALKELRKHIDNDQVEWLALNGREDVGKAAQEAVDYYKNIYAPTWRDGVLEDIQETFRDNLLSPIKRTEKTLGVLKGTLTDPERRLSSEQVAKLFKEHKGDAGQLTRYFKLKALEDITPAIQANGTVDEKILDQVIKPLRDMAPAIKAADEKVYNEFNEFLTSLRDKKFTAKEAEDRLNNARETFASEMDEFQNKFGNFFEDTDMTMPRESNEVFSEIMSKETAPREISDLAKNPKNIPGLRNSFIDELNNQIFKDDLAPTGMSGERVKAPVKEKDFNRVMAVGKELYKDNPETAEAIEKIAREFLKTGDGPMNKLPVGDFGQTRKEASGIVDMAITMIWGPLNRAGSRIRSGAGRALNVFDPKDEVKQILDRLASNPEEFSKLVDELKKDIKSKQNRISGKTARLFGEWAYKGGLISAQDRERYESDLMTDNQTDQALKESEGDLSPEGSGTLELTVRPSDARK